MLKSNKYFYEDEYMYFTFKQRHSSIYNLIITNSKGITMFTDRGSKVETTQPQYQSGQYLLGVSHPQRPFPLKLFGCDLTEEQIDEILNWLRIGSTGFLSFDYSADWEHNVVVSSLRNPVKTIAGYNTFNIEIEITFNTLNSSIAKNKNDGYGTIVTTAANSVLSNYNNEYQVPVFTLSSTLKPSYSELLLRIHCLGDDKVEIGFKAWDNISSGEKKYVEMSTNDVNAYYTKALLKGSASANGQPIELEYRPYSNMFFINNYVAEEYIKSFGILQEKSSANEHINDYSNVIYNKTAMSFVSPGAPVLLNKNTNIGALLTTPFHWFLCKKTITEDSSIPYYITALTAATQSPSEIIYDTAMQGVDFNSQVTTIQALINSLQSNEKLYFGFYQDVVLNTTFATISPIVTQYKYCI